MCSAAWIYQAGGYEIRFNRDEKWNRPPSADPMFETARTVPGLCARDGAAGGTWLFANERGITLALLNAYPKGALPAAGKRSRGMLPLAAAEMMEDGDVSSALARIAWEEFAPCHLLAWSVEEARSWSWDGTTFTAAPRPARDFLTTSSVRTEEIRLQREARFDALAGSPLAETMDDVNASDPAAAIFASRADGGTVSQTRVTVTPREIRMAVRRRGEDFIEVSCPRQP